MSRARIAVLVPIYQRELPPLDRFSLDRSLARLRDRDVAFIGPDTLDTAWYAERYPGVPFIGFEPHYFASIQGYNALMLSAQFYRRFADREFMLVLQTDAVLLRDELDHWANQPFDYLGAPWPDGVTIQVALDQFAGAQAKTVRAVVGNGGLSLRRNRACLALLDEFPQALDYFRRSGSSEDLFFAVMGALSQRFVLPGEYAAARFSTELKPSHYAAVHGTPPMGGHAWWKYEPQLWLRWLGQDAVAALRQHFDDEAARQPAAA